MDKTPGRTDKSPTPNTGKPPDGFTTLHMGEVLPAFYAAQMLQPLIGKTVWVKDRGGRTRCGELVGVPNVKEESAAEPPPVTFADERPLFLRGIVHIAVYEGWEQARDKGPK